MKTARKPEESSVKNSLNCFLRILKYSGIGKTKSSDGCAGEITERLQAFLFIVGMTYICYLYLAEMPEKLDKNEIVMRLVPHIDFFLVSAIFFYLYLEGLFSRKNLDELFDSFSSGDKLMEKYFGISFDYGKFEKISVGLAMAAVLIPSILIVDQIVFEGFVNTTEKIFVTIHFLSYYLYITTYVLLLSIFWQVKVRFEELTKYFELMARKRSIKIQIDKISKIYVILYDVVQKSNDIFGFFQLFYVGGRG